MRGLLLKDFINLKNQKQFNIILFVVIIYIIWAMYSKDSSIITPFVTLLPVCTINTISYDEKANWDKYALSMPISRADIVMSKYILSMILLVISFLIYEAVIIINGDNFYKVTASSLNMFSSMLLCLSITLPLLIKFGTEKLMLFCYILYCTPFLFQSLIISSDNISLSSELIHFLLFIFPFVALAAYVISLAISLIIYNNKDF